MLKILRQYQLREQLNISDDKPLTVLRPPDYIRDVLPLNRIRVTSNIS